MVSSSAPLSAGTLSDENCPMKFDRRSVWWLWPAAPLLLLVGPTLVAAALISDSVYERAWRTPKGLDGSSTTLLLGVVVAIVAGTLVVALAERDRTARPGVGWPDVSDETIAFLRRAYVLLIALTLFGYGVWLAVGLTRGLTFGDVRTVLATQDNFNLPIKDKLATLPGITTLTQAAIPAAVIGVLLDAHRPNSVVRWGYRVIIALAVARAFLLAERLAVAEIVVPVIVVRATLTHRRTGPRGRRFVAMAPVIGLLVLLAGFSISEYSRSWNWYSDQTDRSFVDFASERLLGYYATSHNNGALLLDHGDVVGNVPYHTTAFVWQVPPGSQFSAGLADDVDDDRRRVLRGFGNPEFNSPGGIASIVIDNGVVGGTVFAFGLGLVLGGLHLGFLHGRLPGLLLYPVAFTGLLELPRYLYWFQGRATPAVVVPIILAVIVSARHRRHQQRRLLASSIPTVGVPR